MLTVQIAGGDLHQNLAACDIWSSTSIRIIFLMTIVRQTMRRASAIYIAYISINNWLVMHIMKTKH